uniref:Transposase n=1 Tax=Globodera pallida TaxID=36090 RepID=A0A183BK76_GLOPA
MYTNPEHLDPKALSVRRDRPDRKAPQALLANQARPDNLAKRAFVQNIVPSTAACYLRTARSDERSIVEDEVTKCPTDKRPTKRKTTKG